MNNNFILLIALSALLVSCNPPTGESGKNNFDGIKVREYIVGGVKFYVPDVYTKTRGASIGRDSGFIQTFYPGSAPIPGDPQALWEQGEWYKNINILFQHADPARAQDVLEGQINLTKSYESVGTRYALEHFTQSDEDQWFHNDIWIDNEKTGSFLSCAERQYESANPQCSHYFFQGNFFIKLTYSTKFLPDWNLIMNNALGLFASFKSRETATAYVQKFYNTEQNNKEDNP